ncbi:MAG: hypothetical protein Q9219_006877 [cf. Caloplaca sp. 3 TL-2023]
MFQSKSPVPPPRDACDECHARKIRCPAGTAACLNCQAAGRICVFSPRKHMGRPKNGARKSAQKLDLISPAVSSSASRDSSPPYQPRYPHHTTSHASSSTTASVLTVTDTAPLVDHDMFQDFSFNAANWNQTALPYGQPDISGAQSKSHFSPHTLDQVYADGQPFYHASSGHPSTARATLNQMYQPYITPPAEVVTPGHIPNQAHMHRHSSQDLFARLSSIQMRLWKCKDHSKTNSTDDDGASTLSAIDGFIQAASDICGVAETVAAWSQDSTAVDMSSHDLESFHFQLMMSVSAALEILSPIVNPLYAPATSDDGRKTKTQSSCLSFVQMQSSFFDLASLKDSESLNTRLTLTTVDFYLDRMAMVVSRIDMVSTNDGLRQAAEEVVKKSQQYCQLISSKLEKL